MLSEVEVLPYLLDGLGELDDRIEFKIPGGDDDHDPFAAVKALIVNQESAGGQSIKTYSY